MLSYGDDAHVEMLDGVLLQLLDRKWNEYGRDLFLQHFLELVVYIVIITIVFALQASDTYSTPI